MIADEDSLVEAYGRSDTLMSENEEEEEQQNIRKSNLELSLISYLGSLGAIKYVKAKRVKVYADGDKNFKGKYITLNKNHLPSMSHVCSEITAKIPSAEGGRVRRMYSANSGRIITSIDEVRDGRAYVAARKRRFQDYKDYQRKKLKDPFWYQNIADIQRSKQKNQRREHQDAHFASSRYKDVQAKAVQQGKEKFGKIIYVYENGNDVDPFNVCCVKQKLLQACNDEQERWRIFLDQISAKAKFKVEKLFKENGMVVHDPDEVGHRQCVYAAKSTKEHFHPFKYGGKRNFQMGSPRPVFGTPPESPRHYTGSLNSSQPLPPITPAGKSEGFKGAKIHSTSSERYGHDRAKRSYENTPNNRPRRAKPRQVDYDQDQSGVYRAKNKGREAAGAQQVKDTQETKTDLPIDQVEAEEVKDENIRDEREYDDRHWQQQQHGQERDPYSKQNDKKMETSTPMRHQSPPDASFGRGFDAEKEEQAATKIQAYARGHKARKEYEVKKNEAERFKQEQAFREQEENERKMREAEERAQREEEQREAEDRREETDRQEEQQQFGMTENDAATRIQAGYKGYKTRKDIKERQVRDTTSTQKYSKSNKEEEEAATRIQAGFKGYRVRKEYKTKLDAKNAEGVQETKKHNEDLAATRIQAGYRGYVTRKNFKTQKPQTMTMTVQDPNKLDESAAATKIQSNYRGYKTRKDLKEGKYQKAPSSVKPSAEDMAATRIQAGYRGYRTRKDLHKKQSEQFPSEAPVSQGTDKDAEDKAATRIQANYRGFKTRQELNKAKGQK